MATNRANKQRRHLAKIVTKIKPRKPEEQIFLEKSIPHKVYDQILIVVDGNIAKRIQMATTGLKLSRMIPTFSDPAELPANDPYVLFYRGERYQNEQGEPVYSLDVAQKKAAIAYSGVLKTIEGDALILALMHYTDFEGFAPEVESESDDEEMAMYDQPPAPQRDIWSVLERKINHIRYMVATDTVFSETLTTSVTEAVAKIREQSLMEAPEEVSEEGFQPESAG
jgi:hypothetical protein